MEIQYGRDGELADCVWMQYASIAANIAIAVDAGLRGDHLLCGITLFGIFMPFLMLAYQSFLMRSLMDVCKFHWFSSG